MMDRLAGRLRAPLFLLALILLMGSASPNSASNDDARFLTNLALLDRLTGEAVTKLLDSLDVAPGDSIVLMADGYNEGNDFVADALARQLAIRGSTVRVFGEVPSVATALGDPLEETETETEPSESDTASAKPEADGSEDQDLPGAADQDQDIAGAEDQDQDEAQYQDPDFGGGFDSGFEDDSDPDEFGSEFMDSDTFAADSTSADSTFFGAVQDTVSEVVDDVVSEETPAPDAEERAAPAPVSNVTDVRVYPSGKIIQFRVLEFGVSYPEARRRFLVFGGASVSRLGGVFVRASHIEGPEGTVLNVASGQSHRRDRLSHSSRLLAEGANYPFTAPTVAPGQVGKLVEPAVVLGIIGSLVYLFYQNQN